MKHLTHYLRHLALLFITVASLRAVPEIAGFYAVGARAGFVFTEEKDGQTSTSSWIKIGESFSGYKLEKFNPKTLKLTLAQDKVRTEISAKPANSSIYRVVMKGYIELPGTKIDNVQLLMFEGADFNFELTPKVTISLRNKRMQDGALLHTIHFITLLDNGTTQVKKYNIAQNPGGKMIIMIDDYILDLTPLK